MKRSPFFYLLAASILVLLLTGIGGCNWLARKSSSNPSPAAAMFVPKQAPAMVSLLVNPDHLQASPLGGRRSRQQLNQLKKSLLVGTGLDYKRDIKPWLGDEITLAVTTTDIDRNGENGRQPGYLMALATKDADKSREFLQQLFSKRAIGTDLVVEKYKGVGLIEEKVLSGAQVGDRFVLFANHPKVLRDAINNVQAFELNLTSSSQYQQALTRLPPSQIGVTFLNLPSVAAWQGLTLNPQTYESQIIALELNSKGLLAETTLLATPEQEISPPAPLSELVGALQYIPSTTGLAIAGSDLSRLKDSNLNQLLNQFSAGLSGSRDDAISRLTTQPLTAIQTHWGLDLAQDIFSWVKGEYALGLLPRTNQSYDWIFVAETDSSRQGILHLDAIAQQQGLSITPIAMGNQEISAWTKMTTAPVSSFDSDRTALTLKAKVQGVHATVGKYEIFTTSVEAMDEALKAYSSRSLIDSPQFQSSINAIPRPNQGYIYLDWTASREILERQLPLLRLLEVPGKSFFSNLQSLTVSSYGSETGLLKGGIFFQLIN